MEQIHQYPEINERGEWFGFDPKRFIPSMTIRRILSRKPKPKSYGELEKRGINGATLDNMFKEETLNKSGGWHWDDGTKPSHSDGGPNEDKTKEDIDSEPKIRKPRPVPDRSSGSYDQIAAEKKNENDKENKKTRATTRGKRKGIPPLKGVCACRALL